MDKDYQVNKNNKKSGYDPDTKQRMKAEKH